MRTFHGDRYSLERFMDRYLDIQLFLAIAFWFLFVGECWKIRRLLTQWWAKRKVAKDSDSQDK